MSARASPDDLASVELARALNAELNGRASRASRPPAGARAPRDDADGVAPSRAFRLHWPTQRVAVRSGGRARRCDEDGGEAGTMQTREAGGRERVVWGKRVDLGGLRNPLKK